MKYLPSSPEHTPVVIGRGICGNWQTRSVRHAIPSADAPSLLIQRIERVELVPVPFKIRHAVHRDGARKAANNWKRRLKRKGWLA
jgi:hypothetical protein